MNLICDRRFATEARTTITRGSGLLNCTYHTLLGVCFTRTSIIGGAFAIYRECVAQCRSRFCRDNATPGNRKVP